MKYSFPGLFPGRFYAIPATGSEPRANRAGNDSLPTAFDEAQRRGGDVRIRAADYRNQGLFLFWAGHCVTGVPGSTWSVGSFTARTINRQSYYRGQSGGQRYLICTALFVTAGEVQRSAAEPAAHGKGHYALARFICSNQILHICVAFICTAKEVPTFILSKYPDVYTSSPGKCPHFAFFITIYSHLWFVFLPLAPGCLWICFFFVEMVHPLLQEREWHVLLVCLMVFK